MIQPISAAADGLLIVSSLDGIAAEVHGLKVLQDVGELDEALVQLEALLVKHPNNPFLLNERKVIDTQIREREFRAALALANKAEAEGDLLARGGSVGSRDCDSPQSRVKRAAHRAQGEGESCALERCC